MTMANCDISGGRRRSRQRHRRRLATVPALVAVVLLSLVAPTHAAEFTRAFTDVTRGADLLLKWEALDARYLPLTIHAIVVNRTGDENRANVFKRNLAVGINGTSWVWENMPSPLPYLGTGLYQVEVRSEGRVNATAGSAPVLPRSPYFSILEANSRKPTGAPAGAPSPGPDVGGGPSSKTISLAVGVVVTLVVLLLAGTGCLCWRKRYLRAKKGKKPENKFDIVIH